MTFSPRVSVLFLALFALLVVAPVVVPAAATDEAPVQAPVVATDCPGASPALAFLVPESALAWWAGSRPSGELTTQEPMPQPMPQQGPPNRPGYCRCGCGIRCETDADCGVGGSCVGFITCC